MSDTAIEEAAAAYICPACGTQFPGPGVCPGPPACLNGGRGTVLEPVTPAAAVTVEGEAPVEPDDAPVEPQAAVEQSITSARDQLLDAVQAASAAVTTALDAIARL